MKFIDDIAAEAANSFKDISDMLWESLGGPEASKSSTVKTAKYTAGKYAVLSTMILMLNYPDNARVFRDAFNVTGHGPDGVEGFAASKSVTANKIARVLNNTQVVSETLSLEAIREQGFADVSATSTLADIKKLLPVLSKPLGKEENK